MRLIDADPLGLTDMEIIMCNGNYKEALKMLINKIEHAPTIEPSIQSEIIRCKDCKHKPVTNDSYDENEWDRGFNIEFPDYECPCQCEDGYYNKLPDDNWFCGNVERRTDE